MQYHMPVSIRYVAAWKSCANGFVCFSLFFDGGTSLPVKQWQQTEKQLAECTNIHVPSFIRLETNLHISTRLVPFHLRLCVCVSNQKFCTCFVCDLYHSHLDLIEFMHANYVCAKMTVYYLPNYLALMQCDRFVEARNS